MLNPAEPKEVKDGRFELPGCAPEQTTQVFFLDAGNGLGAVAELSGKDAGKPLTVRLRPCGRATARLVDKAGRPVKDVRASVQFVLTPGVPCLIPVLVLRFDDRPEQGIGGVVLRLICRHGYSVPPFGCAFRRVVEL